MKIVNQLEEKINNLIFKFWDKYSDKIMRFYPTHFLHKLSFKKEKILFFLSDFSKNAKVKTLHFIHFLIHALKDFLVELKTSIQTTVHTVKSINWKELKKDDVLSFIKNFINGHKIGVGASVMSFLLAIPVTYYFMTKPVPKRDIASELVEVERPDFHLIDDRAIAIPNFSIPVYREGDTDSTKHKLTIGLVVYSDNRFIKQFLKNHEYLLRDKLSSSFEPVPYEMPVSDETKRIIKDKVIAEINDLLEKNEVEGKIEDAQYLSIMSL